MSIHPGYSGQPFREETFGRVERLRAELPGAIPIQVDGGVGGQNIRELRDRGATLLVAASAIFARVTAALIREVMSMVSSRVEPPAP